VASREVERCGGAATSRDLLAHPLLPPHRALRALVELRRAGLLRVVTAAELAALGVLTKNIDHVMVPGALEVPLALQALAEKNNYDALIALGCIIRGETYHFELVANESGAGVTRVSLDYHLPIANAILTVENMEQAVARQTDKGRDAARVAVEMAKLMEAVE